jgi:hypothetical protein
VRPCFAALLGIVATCPEMWDTALCGRETLHVKAALLLRQALRFWMQIGSRGWARGGGDA